MRDLFGAEAEDPARRGSGAKHAAGGGRVKALLVVFRRIEREAQPDLDLVAGHDGGNRVSPAGAAHLRRRQRRGHDGRARVDGAGRMGIVEIQRMAECAIQKGGRRRRIAVGLAQDRRVPRAHPQLLHRSEGRGGELGLVARSECDTELIHDQQPGALGDGVGQVLVGDGRGESGEGFGYGGHGRFLGVAVGRSKAPEL